MRVQLTRAVFQHPANPYECYLISLPEQRFCAVFERLEARGKRQEAEAATLYLPDAWRTFGSGFKLQKTCQGILSSVNSRR